MTDQTKQPTLPGAIALVRVALDKLSRLGNEPHVGNSVGNQIAQEALAALDSLRVSEPVAWRLTHKDYDFSVICHTKDQVVDRQAYGWEITREFCDHAAPCARCAEWDGDQYPGKEHIAALEAELKERDLQLRHLLCIIHRDGGHHTQAHGLEQSIEDAKEKFFDLRDLPATIAQQAERIDGLTYELSVAREANEWLGKACDARGAERNTLEDKLTAANALIEKCEFALKSNAENGIGNYTVAEAVSAITDYQAKKK